MNNQRNFYIVIGIVAVGLMAAFIAFWPRQKNYSWRERYSLESEDPYGLKLLYETLDRSASSTNPVRVINDTLADNLPLDSLGSNYLFIGEGIYLDSLDQAHLQSYIQKGNTAFLILRILPEDLLDAVYPEDCAASEWFSTYEDRDTLVKLSFLQNGEVQNSDYSISQVRKKEVIYRDWAYLDDYFFYCAAEDTLSARGTLGEGRINFFRLQYGDGSIYIHLTPLAFTNYQFVKPSGRDYVATVFEQLSDGPIYWDDYNQISDALARGLNSPSGGYRKTFDSQGPLQYILSQPALAWAWYLTLAAAALFLLFRAKRRQRIIPVLAENKNNSLEFIQMISQLYLSQNDHRKLALQKMRLWRNHLRDRYQFHLKDQPEAEDLENLAAKTGTSIELIEQILANYKSIYRSLQIKEAKLRDFHEVLNTFYQTSK